MLPRFDRLLAHTHHFLTLDGCTIAIYPGVFSPDPALTHSTEIILRHLPPVEGLTIADVGCGTGLIAILCAQRNAKHVIATDISEAALANTQENIARSHLEAKITIRKSSLLQDVSERFDLIIANLPIDPAIWQTGSVTPIELLAELLATAPSHLTSTGMIYVPWGSFREIAPVRALLQASVFRVEEIQEEALGYTWTLFILTRRSP